MTEESWFDYWQGLGIFHYFNPYIRGWSEKFLASIIDGNTIGKIFFPRVGTTVISIHVKLQVILSSSLFYTAV